MKVFVVDQSRCNGCRSCQISCKDEHVDNDWSPYAKPEPDTGQFWCKVDERTCGQVPHVQVSYRFHACNHCDNPVCSEVCPEHAVYKRQDGLVIIDPEKCVGCMQCAAACPYDAIYGNDELHIAQKCTGCAHLLDDGWEKPRCADACPTGALRFGDYEDFSDEISDAVVLQPECGTGPRIYYLNDPKRFVAGTVVDLVADEVLIGATVELIADETVVATTETDDFGDFWFRRIEPRCYSVRVSYPGYFIRQLEVDVTDQERSLGAVEMGVAQ